ncbi:sensor histidine kinase [Nocardia transvalensis]|nr:sensor histidine kinase [Nocardia transvalensis]
MRIIVAALLAVNLGFNHRGPLPVWMWVALGAAYACLLVFAVLDTRRPRIAIAALVCCALISAAVVGPATDSSALLMTCAAISLLSQQLTASATIILLAFAADAATVTASSLLAGQSTDDPVTSAVILLILLLLGLYRRQYRFRVRETELLLEQTRRTQHEQARAVALDERARIAREIHDVLAHSLGALAVQLDVAEGLLSEKGDVPGALARVRRSRRLAASGLTEARAAVTALREDVPPLDEALRALADTYRRDHHMIVDYRVTGTPHPVNSATTVSLLRAAREALTNAGKHAAGAPVSMVLSFERNLVRLSVHNPASVNGKPRSDGGYGLTGMRERIALVGGSLSAGPGQDGRGWQVTAEVPQ